MLIHFHILGSGAIGEPAALLRQFAVDLQGDFNLRVALCRATQRGQAVLRNPGKGG